MQANQACAEDPLAQYNPKLHVFHVFVGERVERFWITRTLLRYLQIKEFTSP